MNSSTRWAELKSHSRLWWALRAKTGRSGARQPFLPSRELVPQETHRAVAIMNMAGSLGDNHSLGGRAAGADHQVISAEIERGGCQVIERHQMLIKSPALRNRTKKGRLNVAVAQVWGKRTAIQYEGKEVRRGTHLRDGVNHTFAAALRNKPGMNDGNAHSGQFVLGQHWQPYLRGLTASASHRFRHVVRLIRQEGAIKLIHQRC